MAAVTLLTILSSIWTGALAAFAEERPGPTGRIAFVSDRDGDPEIYVMQADGSGILRLTKHAGNDSMPAWSPDGRQLAFVSHQDGDEEIYIMDADGQHVAQVTNNQVADLFPAWSPSGDRIAFISMAKSDGVLCLVRKDGSDFQATGRAISSGRLAWSPDGSRIAFSAAARSGNPFELSEIFVMDVGGWEETAVSRGRACLVDPKPTNEQNIKQLPAWSPDGQWIAYTSGGCKFGCKICLIDIEGSTVQDVTSDGEGAMWPTWSPDGKWIAFETARRGESWDIGVADVSGSWRKNLTSHPASDSQPAWSPVQSRER